MQIKSISKYSVGICKANDAAGVASECMLQMLMMSCDQSLL